MSECDSVAQILNTIAYAYTRYAYWKRQIAESDDESHKQSHRLKAAIEKKMLIAILQGFMELLDAD